ncbi:uncharacterized protein UTRI_02493 [Ustilago trichophora]|uniref:Alpha/beta hydrolase fold-3 domain-containing protein n=1 Tax=Ustilago trichophora TaxID=86804 RepID=A0A5C3E992_9BASI|nr:uncharacterized protein UTRI_02493 [Ustilago trichophora]
MSLASSQANASTGFQLLSNPTNPSLPKSPPPSNSSEQEASPIPKLPNRTVLNWHGSGYVVDRFGADADTNRWLVEALSNATVVDGDYPWFDGNLVVKGHSAGANFALDLASRSIALSLGLTAEEYSTIKACVTLYPPTDASIPLIEKKTNENGELPGIPMSALSYQIMQFFFGAYLGWDPEYQQKMAKDPRVSPALAPLDSFEVPCYIIACEHDPLGEEAKQFAEKLVQHDSNKHALYFAKGVGHSYETRIPDVRAEGVLDVPGGKAKVESYEKMVEFIRKNVATVKLA